MEPQFAQTTASATPLLDRIQPLATRKRWRAILISAVIQIIIIVAILHGMDSITQSGILGFVYCVAAVYISVFVHEAGHAIAGLACGFELRGLSVCGLLLDREKKGWRLRFVPRQMFAVLGFANMTPRSTDRLTQRYTWLILGGPAASVCLSLIALALPAGLFSRVFLTVNLVLMASCCIPYTTRGMSSDARFLMILRRKGVPGERLAAILYLVEIDAEGIPPRDWPQEIVDRIRIPANQSPLPTATVVLNYAAALDRDETTTIAAAIEDALALSVSMMPESRRYFMNAAACYHASVSRDIALAETWLQSARAVKAPVTLTDWDSKAMALIALAKGESESAADFLTRYLALVERRRPCGMLVAERTRTLALLTQIREQIRDQIRDQIREGQAV